MLFVDLKLHLGLNLLRILWGKMSLYAEYLQERTEDFILENDKGFVTWRYLNERQVYLIDIYVVPEFRRSQVATTLADYVASIAKNTGRTELFGTVVPSAKGSNASLKVLWDYGMILYKAEPNLIVMRKDI